MWPFIELFGIKLPSYGLCMAIGLFLSCYISMIRARKNNLNVNSFIIIVACAIAFGLLGAKLLYLLISCDIKVVFSNIHNGDFSDFANSGQVFYGGLIGGFVGALIGIQISGEKKNLSLYLDSIIPTIPLGHAFGRIGCFFGGCCYGIPYSGFCSVTFPLVGVYEPVLPIQLIEAGLNIIIFFLLTFMRKNKRNGFTTLYLYIILYSVIRFVLEFYRGDEIRGVSQVLSTSQWISIGLLLCCCITSVLSIGFRKRKAKLN